MCLPHGEAESIVACARLTGTQAHLRVELEELAEGDVVHDVAPKIRTVKGCQRTDAAVQRHILRRYDIIEAAAQLRRHLAHMTDSSHGKESSQERGVS